MHPMRPTHAHHVIGRGGLARPRLRDGGTGVAESPEPQRLCAGRALRFPAQRMVRETVLGIVNSQAGGVAGLPGCSPNPVQGLLHASIGPGLPGESPDSGTRDDTKCTMSPASATPRPRWWCQWSSAGYWLRSTQRS